MGEGRHTHAERATRKKAHCFPVSIRRIGIGFWTLVIGGLRDVMRVRMYSDTDMSVSCRGAASAMANGAARFCRETEPGTKNGMRGAVTAHRAEHGQSIPGASARSGV